MDYDSDLVRIGKNMEVKDKEFEIEGSKFDLIKKRKNKIIVEEDKKSNKLKELYKWQVKYYLFILRKKGIDATGEIVYKENKEKEEVRLREEDIEKVEMALKEIPKIIKNPKPPEKKLKPYCKSCSYYYLCWVDEDEK